MMGILSRLRNRNPYKPPTKEELDELQQIENSARADLEAFSELSARIMADPNYLSLVKLYQRILSNTLRLMIWYDPPVSQNAMETFFDKMRGYQRQLRVISQIVELPAGFKARADSPIPSTQASESMKVTKR